MELAMLMLAGGKTLTTGIAECKGSYAVQGMAQEQPYFHARGPPHDMFWDQGQPTCSRSPLLQASACVVAYWLAS